MRSLLLAACISTMVAAGFASDSLAQVKPEDHVLNRQAAMRLQGKYLSPMVQMARGRVPYDAGTVSRNAAFLQVLLQMPWDGFDASTQRSKSAALPSVFKEPEKFKAAQDAVQKEAAKLVEAAKGGDEATVKPAILSLSDACNNCHDNFRKKQ